MIWIYCSYLGTSINKPWIFLNIQEKHNKKYGNPIFDIFFFGLKHKPYNNFFKNVTKKIYNQTTFHKGSYYLSHLWWGSYFEVNWLLIKLWPKKHVTTLQGYCQINFCFCVQNTILLWFIWHSELSFNPKL
jgi:hypothetical protein